jgi:Uma2 family endonuclease
METRGRATIEDLYRAGGKAELINGEVVILSLTGGRPGFAADEIFFSLRAYSKRTRKGWAVADNKAFHVQLAQRESFSPDAAYYVGPDPGMKFFEGAPVFAVEVRNETDYGSQADADIATKRADYFEAGTLVVWDVDLLNRDVIRSYHADDPANPKFFGRGKIANAEPAVHGWSIHVDDLFAQSS